MIAGRTHLKPYQFWKKLDEGELHLKELFDVPITTGFVGPTIDGRAVVNVYKTHDMSCQLELVISLEESIHEFPSEHLIAQIMLVT